MFLESVEELQMKLEGKERKEIFVIRQSQANQRKNREMRKYTWFEKKDSIKN